MPPPICTMLRPCTAIDASTLAQTTFPMVRGCNVRSHIVEDLLHVKKGETAVRGTIMYYQIPITAQFYILCSLQTPGLRK